MNIKLTMMGLAAVCLSFDVAAMPTEKELNRAAPVVKKLLASDESDRRSHKKTWSEVAATAVRLADKSETEAEKLLLMKGAFSYYVKDGDLEKAVETMMALEAAISGMPQKYVKNIIETALRGVPRKNATRFYQLRAEAKKSAKNRPVQSVASGDGRHAARTRRRIAAKCENLQTNTVDGICWLYADAGNSVSLFGADSPLPRDLVIPDEIDGKKVLTIEENAFEGCEEIVSLETPSKVMSIGKSAFAGCPNLESVRIRSGSVRWSVFRGCPKLKSVFVGGKVRSLEYGSLAACEKLESVVIEEGTVGLKIQDAFEGDVALKSLHLPARYDGTESWCHGAFGGCPNLTKLTITEGNPNCRAENELVLSADGKTLLAVASGLSKIDIPPSVETISYGAIKRCDQIHELVFPDTVKTICAQSIGDCSALASLVVGKGVNSFKAPLNKGSMFYKCPVLTSVRFMGNAPADVYDKIYEWLSPALITYVPRGSTGWNRDGGEKLPALWPVDGVHGRKIAYWGDMSVKSFEPECPYGIHMMAEPGCEDGADYVLGKLTTVYLPRAARYYGDPFNGKKPSRIYLIKVKRSDKGMSYYPGTDEWSISLAKDSDAYEFSLDYLASSVLTVCEEPNWGSFVFYVNKFVEADAKGQNPAPQLRRDIEKGLSDDGGDNNSWYRAHAPLWAALEDLRAKHPKLILDYCKLKNKRFAEGKLPKKLTLDQMAALLGEVSGADASALFKKYGVRVR